MNNLSIIIPSKTRSNLEACVRSIRAAGETCRIVIVDDFPQEVGGGHPLADCNGYLAKSPGPAQPLLWCRGEKPFIFARNVNMGIEAARNDDVIVLNDDALLATPRGFTMLQRTAYRFPDYGIIAAACNNVGNQNQLPRNTGGLRDEPRMVCFTCVLISRNTIETVGLLDTRFVNYGLDDDDYSLRVLRSGMKIGIHDGCVVNHSALKSTYRGDGPADFRPNLKLFIEKWGVDNHGYTKEHSNFRELFPA